MAMVGLGWGHGHCCQASLKNALYEDSYDGSLGWPRVGRTILPSCSSGCAVSTQGAGLECPRARDVACAPDDLL